MSFFRLDRLLTLYFFYPLTRLRSSDREPRIPILMYHSISDSKQERIHPYYQTTTSPQVFVQHMKFLHDNGYSVINLRNVSKYLVNRQKRNCKAAVLTFDDGFRDFYTKAFPVFQKHGFSATVFLPTAFIDNNRLKFKGKECLSWEEVRELHSKGVTFGSHTVNHPKLTMLKKDDIEFEIRRSKEKIEHEIGKPIKSFSYPYAFPETDNTFRKRLRSIIEAGGYENGVTTSIRTAAKGDDVFFLKRIPVNSFDDLTLFRAKLEAGYDWLHKLQYFVKLAKRSRKLPHIHTDISNCA